MPKWKQIEDQLKFRVSECPPTPWGRTQEDNWDQQTTFIYRIHEWKELQRKVENMSPDMSAYAINRWFNFWSARAVEEIFCALPRVYPNQNKYDKLVDFTLHGIKFDLKTSVFPKGYPRSIEFAMKNKKDLVLWLYENQSQAQRHHMHNRLFIVLHAKNGVHWRLRADIERIAQIVHEYVRNFNPSNLINFENNGHVVVSDIIWFLA